MQGRRNGWKCLMTLEPGQCMIDAWTTLTGAFQQGTRNDFCKVLLIWFPNKHNQTIRMVPNRMLVSEHHFWGRRQTHIIERCPPCLGQCQTHGGHSIHIYLINEWLMIGWTCFWGLLQPFQFD